ncbi:RNA-binding protein [Candidatus Woesearchaeota archaeon]|nr:RNA-binding protein [Candidatus Woesearchaeota archaeon]
MSEKQVCISCKQRITNISGTAKFSCPKCSGYELVRCQHCRKIAAKFTCPACSFTGPN